MAPDDKEKSQDVVLAEMSKDIQTLLHKVEGLEKRLDKDYVTRNEMELAVSNAVNDEREKRRCVESELQLLKSQFQPIQKLVYGMVGLILASVVGALVALVVT